MLSLFCEVLCVLAQLNNSAADPAATMLRKIRVVSFIDSDVPWYQINRTFAIPALTNFQESIVLYFYSRAFLVSLAVGLIRSSF